MASPEKKARSKSKKRFQLSDIDLARAATAPINQRRSIIKQATGGGGYDRYKCLSENKLNPMNHL